MPRTRLVFGMALTLCLCLASVTCASAQNASPGRGYSVPSGSSGSSATITQPQERASKGGKNVRNETSLKQPAKLPDIAITATRIAQPVGEIGTTITVVHDKQIQDQKIQQVSDALREVPGVTVNQSGSAGTETSVFIRGASPSQTLTLIDGVEVNSATAGSFDFSNL